jgi:hypothetical protein
MRMTQKEAAQDWRSFKEETRKYLENLDRELDDPSQK